MNSSAAMIRGKSVAQRITTGSILIIVCHAVVATAALGQDRVRIDSHIHEAIIFDQTATISGSGAPDSAGGGPNLTLTVGGERFTIPVAAGRWNKNGVPLGVGPTKIGVRHGTASHEIIITRGRDIAARPPQRVGIEWLDPTDDELRLIAQGTLDPPLDEVQLTAFVTGVRLQTLTLVRRAYGAIAEIEIFDGVANGADVHMIRMQPDFGGIFGQSLYDCGNRDLRQNSEVWVGTYRRSMVRSFLPGEVDSVDWAPMRKSDSVQTRIDDVANALARTAAHELAHSLGLVGSRDECRWMRGCSDGHNCEQFDLDNGPFADRFAKGRYIMDPGDRTENVARLGEVSTSGRAQTRQPAKFNAFNRSYLAIIHPPQ